LVDNHAEVRKAAHDALKKIGTDKALKAITDAPFMLLVKHMTEGGSQREETVKQIGQYKIKEAAPLLIKACNDEFKSVRATAARSIGILREKSAVNALTKLLNDPYYDVRLEAVRALEKIFDPQALKAIEKAMSDPNKNVRDEARVAYYSLKSRLEKVYET
ncbi:MAG TPA: HEAT repeat domain-containing protein, partial [Spirochaetota bacterium]|nr:HEAT repeat domain-containing protein [Spirochaetota bacterium]